MVSWNKGPSLTLLKKLLLLSLGQLCNDKCITHLTKTHLFIFKNNELILTRFCNNNDGLCSVPIPQTPQQVLKPNKRNSIITSKSCLNVITKRSTIKKYLALYHHVCIFLQFQVPFWLSFVQATSSLYWVSHHNLFFKICPKCIYSQGTPQPSFQKSPID